MKSDAQYQAIALCTIGLEKVLQSELRHLRLPMVHRQGGMVWFQGSLSDIFCANLCLRSAERILLEVLSCEVSNFDDLFEALQGPAWEQFFGPEDSLVVERVRIRYRGPEKSNAAIQSQVACQSVVQKAIYHRLCQHYGLKRLPESGNCRSLRVYVENLGGPSQVQSAVCRIALDCSGEALHRRSYRKFTGPAPLKESIAAGLLLFSGWRRKTVFLDPFCGSGTLAIEAALFGLDIAPGLQRDFAMESFPCLQDPQGESAQAEKIANLRRSEQEKAKENLASSQNGNLDLKIFASDCDRKTLEGAKANAQRAGLGSCIEFRQTWAQQLQPPAESGLLLCNPPYGERLSDRQAVRQLYAELGDMARGKFSQWALGFISSSPNFEEDFAGTADLHCHVVNGQADEFLYYYEAP